MVQLHPATAINAFNVNYYELYDSSINALRTLLINQMHFMLSSMNQQIAFSKEDRYSLVETSEPEEEIKEIRLVDDIVMVTLHLIKEDSDVEVNICDFDDLSSKYVKLFEENIRYTIGLFYLVKQYYLQTLRKE